MLAPANYMAGYQVDRLGSILATSLYTDKVAVSRHPRAGCLQAQSLLSEYLHTCLVTFRVFNMAHTVMLQRYRRQSFSVASSVPAPMASDAEARGSTLQALYDSIFGLPDFEARLDAFCDACRAARDAGNGGALALLCQGGVIFGASAILRVLGGARWGRSRHGRVVLEEAVGILGLAVDCAADGAICHSLPCAELYVGLVSLLGPVGSVEAGQQLAELQGLLASPSWWAGSQVTNLLASSALQGRRRAPPSSTVQVATGPVACACQGPDEEKLRFALLKRCSALLARPLAGSSQELPPGLFYDPGLLYDRLRGLDLPGAGDALPDSLRERLQSIVRQAGAQGQRGAAALSCLCMCCLGGARRRAGDAGASACLRQPLLPLRAAAAAAQVSCLERLLPACPLQGV